MILPSFPMDPAIVPESNSPQQPLTWYDFRRERMVTRCYIGMTQEQVYDYLVSTCVRELVWKSDCLYGELNRRLQSVLNNMNMEDWWRFMGWRRDREQGISDYCARHRRRLRRQGVFVAQFLSA